MGVAERIFGSVIFGFLTAGVVVIREADVVLIQRLEHAAVLADGRVRHGLHVAVQGVGGLVAGGNGIDDELRSGVDVAAHEDVRILGLVGQLVGDRVVAVPEGHLGALQELTPFDGLADGEHDLVAFDGLRDVFVVNRRESAGLGIDGAEALLQHDAAHVIGVVHEDFLRTPAVDDVDPGFERFLNFGLGGGHFFAGFE